MLAFDPIGAMSCDFLRVYQYFAVPPILCKRSTVVKLERERERGEPELNRRRATSE